MHGYAHNRRCQISHHPKYTSGCGLEDFETCERFFSLSNNCAGITRYTTPFHRHQLLDTHFHDSDESRRLSIGKFIYNNYKDALTRIKTITKTFLGLEKLPSLTNNTYEKYLEEEDKLLNSLILEPYEDIARFRYVDALEEWWAAEKNWNEKASKAGHANGNISPYTPLPPHLTEALFQYNRTNGIAMQIERILKISCRWAPTSKEYEETVEWANERKYRLALDKLERLVVQRIFELQKANLVSTGIYLCSLPYVSYLRETRVQNAPTDFISPQDSQSDDQERPEYIQ